MIAYFHFNTCEYDHSAIRQSDGTYTYQTVQSGNSYTAVCKKCGEEFPIALTQQSATCKISRATTINSAPYEKARVADVKVGDTYTIIGYADNAYGNRWYKTTDNQWLLGEHIELSVLPVTVSLTGTGTPGNLPLGNDGHLSGTITASGGTIKSIKTEVFRAGTNTSVLTPVTVNNINKASYSLYSMASGSLDMQLTFGSIKNVGEYQIRYTVTASDGKTTEMKSAPFQIGTVAAQPKTYTITFDANGGNVTERTRSVVSGNTIGALPEPQRDAVTSGDNRTNYWFDGWYTAASGGSQVSASTTVNSNIILYTHWTESYGVVSYRGYIITFDANGGSVTEDSKIVSSKPPANLGTLPEPTYDGHSFDGWYTARSGGSKVGETTTASDDMTLYAHWTKNNDTPPTLSPWSEWSTTPVTATATCEVETRQVKVSDAYTEYRYGRYVDPTGKHDCWCATYFKKIGYTPILQYSDWGTAQYSTSGKAWTCGKCGGTHIGADHVGSDGRSWWAEYLLPNGSYYWRETRTIPETYQTQYRYRDLQ